MADSQLEVRHFPFLIGRSSESELILRDQGVWDQHLRIDLIPEGYLHCQVIGQAIAMDDKGQSFQNIRLNNGQKISIGETTLQFWISTPIRKGNRIKELISSGIITFMTLIQLFLVYLLLR